MVYVNDKPLLLVCNNTVYVKNLEILEDIMSSSERGIPYEGSKEHYILDMDNKELCHQIIELIEPITSIPKKRNKKFMEPSMNNPVDRQDTWPWALFLKNKDKSVFIFRKEEEIVTLGSREREDFLIKMQGASLKEVQLVMAKITGNFKHGNEKKNKK